MTLLALLCVNKAQAAEAYAVFSGNTLTFYYDSNKKTRSGNVYGMNSTGLPGWNTHKASIQKVVFDASFANARPTSCRSWFYDFSNLTTITGIGYLNTSEVTTMYCMFYKCSALTSLDVSKFNTAKVTTMRGMFYNCGNVKVLNVSGFNTANVTSMRTMFYNCAGVSTLDVSRFNTAKVEDFNQMFYECNGLTSLNLSSFTFNTGITSQYMIPIAGLKWLAVPSTANNLEDNTCTKIGTKAAPCELSYPSGFTPQKTSTGSGWYMWKSGYFKDATSATTKAYAVLSGSTLTFYNDASYGSRSGTVYDLNSGNTAPDWNSKASTVTKVVFNSNFASARPNTCYRWFYTMNNLSTITGINYLNTSKVTNMGSMFSGCSSLTAVDVSGFDVSNVTTFAYMFYGCAKITELKTSEWENTIVTNMSNMVAGCAKLESFDFVSAATIITEEVGDGEHSVIYSFQSNVSTKNVTNMSSMFSGCTSLKSLNLEGFDLSKNPTTTNFLKGCSALEWVYMTQSMNNLNAAACSGVGTASKPCEMVFAGTIQGATYYSNYFVWKGGYFYGEGFTPDDPDEVKGYAVLSGTTLTFYYDDIYKTRSGTVYDLNSGSNKPAWNAKASTVKTVVFDESFFDASPTSTYYWFGGMTNLTAINDIENLDTRSVTNMAYMFYGCSSLKTLNVGNFDTSSVTNMAYMFSGCSKLTALQLYYEETAIEYSLYETNFTTKAASNMSNMFAGCSSLKELVLVQFTVTSGTNTTNFLKGCSALETLYIDTNLNSLDASALSGVGTASAPCLVEYHEHEAMPQPSSIKPTYYVWKSGYCRSLQQGFAELSEDGKTLTFKYEIFDNYSWSGHPRDIYPLNQDVDDTEWMEKAGNITKVVFEEDFKYVRPVSTSCWFMDMNNLTQIVGINYLNTSETTAMYCMFAKCNKLASIDLSHFDTSKVETMWSMFSECKSLLNIDVSKFNTSNCESFRNMFYGCSSIKAINLSGFNTAKAYTMDHMFYGCTSLESLDLSSFTNIPETKNEIVGTPKMLKNCSSLKTLTIPSAASKFHSSACEGVGTASKPCTLVYPSGFNPEKTATGNGYYVWKSGYFKDVQTTTGEAYAVFSGNTLTFYYDNNKKSRSGNVYGMNSTGLPGWNTHKASIQKVVFDASFANARPTSCRSWFYDFSNLTTITGIGYLNTSEVTTMYCMFYKCSALTSLDVSKFNTAKVTTMRGMFYNCGNVKVLNVSGFNTANVTSMRTMFYNCAGVSTLDVSRFNTAKVEDFNQMFYECNGLTSLNLSSFTFNTGITSQYMIPIAGLKWLAVPSTANNLEDNTCTKIGTKAAPCELSYPSGFTPTKTSSGSGWYVWKSGYFKDAEWVKGDVDHDNETNVVDVMLVINDILNKKSPSFHFTEADMNGNGKIEVDDAMMIVDIVLHLQKSAPAHGRGTTSSMSLSRNGNTVTLHLDATEPFTAFEMTLALPAGCTLTSTKVIPARSRGHQVITHRLDDGRYRVAVVTFAGTSLADNGTPLLQFTMEGLQADELSVDDILLTNQQYEEITLPGIQGVATGINELEVEEADAPIYSIQGIQTKTPTRGIYIQNGRKVVIRR